MSSLRSNKNKISPTLKELKTNSDLFKTFQSAHLDFSKHFLNINHGLIDTLTALDQAFNV